MSEKLPRCVHCYRPFHASVYNAGRQKACTRAACVRRSKRRRQSRWYVKKYHEDEAFGKHERQRAAAGQTRRRAATAQARAGSPAPVPSVPEVSRLELILAGLVSTLTDNVDRQAVQASLDNYAARGQRLAGNIASGP